MAVQFKQNRSGTVDTPGLLAPSLPPQILDKVTERVCLVTMIVATLTITLVPLGAWLDPVFAEVLKKPFLRISILFMVFSSVALFVAQRTGWLTRAHIVNLALVFQVVVSFCIGVLETANPWYEDAPVRGMSFLGVWFFLSAFLLPNAPLRMAIAAVLSVLAWLVAYRLNIAWSGVPPFPENQLLVLLGQIAVTGGWMLAINRMTLASQVQKYKAEQLGSYELESVIGSGGMGEVWKAKHKLLARDAAVKLIRPDVLRAATGREESALLKRFEREAQATARLRSPHTVALYDYGQAGDGTLYYVMELLNGIDLQSMVERFGPLPAGRVRNILIEVCESLEEAHRAGLVHRDIKPKNIVLAKLGLQYDFVKVLDFGLVKINHTEGQSTVTVEGITAGTPAYIAPEVAVAKTEIDGRADLYSLGCVAYFLLTGYTLFDESSPVAHAIAHLQSPVVPPSQRTELPIPASLEAVVMALLEKKPEDRIQSAYELARRLRGQRDIPEFCPYTAADWWNTNLPDAVAATNRGLETPVPTAIIAESSGEIAAAAGMQARHRQ